MTNSQSLLQSQETLKIPPQKFYSISDNFNKEIHSFLQRVSSIEPGRPGKKGIIEDGLLDILTRYQAELISLIPNRDKIEIPPIEDVITVHRERHYTEGGKKIYYLRVPEPYRQYYANIGYNYDYPSVMDTLLQPKLYDGTNPFETQVYGAFTNKYNNYQTKEVLDPLFKAHQQKSGEWLEKRVEETTAYLTQALFDNFHEILKRSIDEIEEGDYYYYRTGIKEYDPNGLTAFSYLGVNKNILNTALKLKQSPPPLLKMDKIRKKYLGKSMPDARNFLVVSVTGTRYAGEVTNPDGVKYQRGLVADNSGMNPGILANVNTMKANTVYHLVISDIEADHPSDSLTILNQVTQPKVITFYVNNLQNDEIITQYIKGLTNAVDTVIAILNQNISSTEKRIEWHQVRLNNLQRKKDALESNINEFDLSLMDQRSADDLRNTLGTYAVNIRTYQEKINILEAHLVSMKEELKVIELGTDESRIEDIKGRILLTRVDKLLYAASIEANITGLPVLVTDIPIKGDYYKSKYSFGNVMVYPNTLSYAPISDEEAADLYGYFPYLLPEYITVEGKTIHLKDLRFNLNRGDLCSFSCLLQNRKIQHLIWHASEYLKDDKIQFKTFYKKYKDIDNMGILEGTDLNLINELFTLSDMLVAITEAGVRNNVIDNRDIYRPGFEQVHAIHNFIARHFRLNLRVVYEDDINGWTEKEYRHGRDDSARSGFAPTTAFFTVHVRVMAGHIFNYSTLNPEGSPQQIYLDHIQENFDDLVLISSTACPEVFDGPMKVGHLPEVNYAQMNFTGSMIRGLQELVGRDLYDLRGPIHRKPTPVKLPSKDPLHNVLAWPLFDGKTFYGVKYIELYGGGGPYHVQRTPDFRSLFRMLWRRMDENNVYIVNLKETFSNLKNHLVQGRDYSGTDIKYETKPVPSSHGHSKFVLRHLQKKIHLKDPKKLLDNENLFQKLQDNIVYAPVDEPTKSHERSFAARCVQGSVTLSPESYMSYLGDKKLENPAESYKRIVDYLLEHRKELLVDESLKVVASGLARKLDNFLMCEKIVVDGMNSTRSEKNKLKDLSNPTIPCSISGISRQLRDITHVLDGCPQTSGIDAIYQKDFGIGGLVNYRQEVVACDPRFQEFLKDRVKIPEPDIREYLNLPELPTLPSPTDDEISHKINQDDIEVEVHCDGTNMYGSAMSLSTNPKGEEVKLTETILFGYFDKDIPYGWPVPIITSDLYRQALPYFNIKNPNFHFKVKVNIKLISLDGKACRIYYKMPNGEINFLTEPGTRIKGVRMISDAVRACLEHHEVEIEVLSGTYFTGYTTGLRDLAAEMSKLRDRCTLNMDTEEDRKLMEIRPELKLLCTSLHGSLSINILTFEDKIYRFDEYTKLEPMLEHSMLLTPLGRKYKKGKDGLKRVLELAFISAPTHQITTYVTNFENISQSYKWKYAKGKRDIIEVLQVKKGEDEFPLGIESKEDLEHEVKKINSLFKVTPEDSPEVIEAKSEGAAEMIDELLKRREDRRDDDFGFLDDLDERKLNTYLDEEVDTPGYYSAISVVKVLYEKLKGCFPYREVNKKNLLVKERCCSDTKDPYFSVFSSESRYKKVMLRWIIDGVKVLLAHVYAKRRTLPEDMEEKKLKDEADHLLKLDNFFGAIEGEKKLRRGLMFFLPKWMELTVPEPIRYFCSNANRAIVYKNYLVKTVERIDDRHVRIIKDKDNFDREWNYCDIGNSVYSYTKTYFYNFIDRLCGGNLPAYGDTDSLICTLKSLYDEIDKDIYYGVPEYVKWHVQTTGQPLYIPPLGTWVSDPLDLRIRGPYGKLSRQIAPETKIEGTKPLLLTTPQGKKVEAYLIYERIIVKKKVYMEILLGRNLEGELILFSDKKASGCDAKRMSVKDYLAVINGFTYRQSPSSVAYPLLAYDDNSDPPSEDEIRSINPISGVKRNLNFEETWNKRKEVKPKSLLPRFQLPKGVLPC